MYGMPVAQRIKEILNLLGSDEVKTIVLYGEPGVGKTWTAREASQLAKQMDLFNVVLWVYLSRKYDSDTLLDSIAQQLSLLPTPGELEVDEVEKEDLPKHIQSLLSKGKLLIVLDDEGRAMREYSIMPLLNSLLRLDNLEHKLLITSNVRLMCNISNWTEYRVDPLSKMEAILLLKKRSCTDEKFIDIDTLAEEIIRITQCIPSEIIVMAKAFKYFLENGGPVALTRYLKEPSFCLTYLFSSGCDLVPNSILIDCQRDGKDKLFLSDSRCVHHNELIAYWITEGYLGNVSCLEKALEKGYKIFMELVDFQVLKRVEGDYVIIKPLEEELDCFLSRFAISDYRRGYYANACLGLGAVFANYGNWNGLMRISRDGGVAGTLYGGKQVQKVSALLLDGDAVAKDSLSKFLKPLKELQVLVIFNPTLALLSHFSSMIHKLHVFVLRSCYDLENIDQVSTKVFESLTVLEISGSSSLVEIPDELFKRLLKLQSLNLSSLPIALQPPSLYDLNELKWLIPRDCSELKMMSSLKKLKNLVVLDCSGSTSLEEIRDEMFANQELQMINLSNTKITNLPVIENLSKLTRLLLSGSPLTSVGIVGNVSSLEVIDLSNASHFHEFYDTFLGELDNLKVLDLLGTKVSTLPGDVGNPRHPCLENCIQVRGEGVLECLAKVSKLERFVLSDAGIQSLPPISHLTRLRQLSVTHCLDLESVPDLNSLQGMEELDFSGCKSIKSLSDKSFDKMYALQKLNLSDTSIESLPSLAKLFSLRHLILKDCKELKTLPFIKSKALKNLEELNVSGCKALKNIDYHFFDGNVNLHTLDLSEAPLDELPSISGLVNLRELHLRNCKGLNRVPHLETRTNLEILDLSGSSVSDLPSLSNLSRLRQLMLKNCAALSLFREMGTLNILGPKVQNLPYRISGLTSLERLDLPSMDDFIGVDSTGTNSEGADSN